MSFWIKKNKKYLREITKGNNCYKNYYNDKKKKKIKFKNSMNLKLNKEGKRDVEK